MQKRLVTFLSVSLLVLMAGFGAREAKAQSLPLVDLFVSNTWDDWTGEQSMFNPDIDLYFYVLFSTGEHYGFNFSGQCVLVLSATRAEIARVAVEPIWMQPGNDMVRSEAVRVTWPNAPVEVTCVPDGYPLGATTKIYTTDWLIRSTATPTYPTTPVVPTTPIVPTTPVVPTTPTTAADCRSTLLSMGHVASDLIFCDGISNQQCAVALLQAGHSPSSLIFCQGADPTCAVTLLQSGGSPSELIFCGN